MRFGNVLTSLNKDKIGGRYFFKCRNSFANIGYFVLMISNCTGECFFFKLKIIENGLRTSMNQSRFIHLTGMSMEGNNPQELDFTAVIQNFAARKIPV